VKARPDLFDAAESPKRPAVKSKATDDD
jgi:hypothetical protein